MSQAQNSTTGLHSLSQGRGDDLLLPATTNPPGPANPPKPIVWAVFGATGHFGRFVVQAALDHGDRVCAIGYSQADDLPSIQAWYPGEQRYIACLCDVRIRQTVQSVLDKVMDTFGVIDVIANCAGYGVIGACEDQDEYEVRHQFETNFMGTLNVIQLSIPYFRERGQGRYLIFSSTSGALGVPGIGPYCATKYAIEGLVESMLYEVDVFNIKLTLVEPGHICRDDVAAGARIPQFGHFRVTKPSEPYKAKDSPGNHAMRMFQWLGDHAPTSAKRAAELVWQLGHCSYPPLRLLLGGYAVESIRDRLKSITEEMEEWKHLHFPPFEGQGLDHDDDQVQYGTDDFHHDDDHDEETADADG